MYSDNSRKKRTNKMSDKKKTTMLDLVGSPSFNYTAAADALNTADAIRVTKKTKKDVVELDRREKIHRALQRFGLATAGASIASPVTAPVTEIAGGIADLTDGILYSLEGEHGNAALSYAAIFPVVGYAVAAKRGMRLAEKSGEELIDIYRGIPNEFVGSKSMTKFKDELYHVGGEFDTFKRLDQDLVYDSFKQTYRGQADKVYLKYLQTGEIPMSKGINKSRLDSVNLGYGDSDINHIGKSKFGYYHDIKPRGKDPYGNTLVSARGDFDSPFTAAFEPRNPLEGLLHKHHSTYYNKDVIKKGINKIPKESMKELKDKFGSGFVRTILGDDAIKAMQDISERKVTTDRFLFATENLEEAQRYGGQVLHFKVPKTYLQDLAKRNKISGYGDKVSDVINPARRTADEFRKSSSDIRSEWIFDEGIPHKFFYKNYGVVQDLSEIR